MTQAPPQAVEAEEALLGGILLNHNTLTAVSDEVTPSDFYLDSNRLIFETALALDEEGKPIDNITICTKLEQIGLLETIGGRSRIQELAALVPSTTNAPHYARIIRETAVRRRLITAGGYISLLGWEGLGDTSELLVGAESHLASVTNAAARSAFVPIGESLPALLDTIQTAYESGKPITGLSTGFIDLDNVTTGLHPGTLTLIAARPSMGKSLLAQNIAEHAAEGGLHAAIFNLEMSQQEIQVRALSRATRIDSKRIRTGNIVTEEWTKIFHAAEQLTTRNLYVDDNPTVTMPELRARARRLKRLSGLDLLVVDYVQLMASGTRTEENRQQEIANISRSLKVLAKELKIPILALSQLNREVEQRGEKRPILSDLRESGALEQDADLVLFLYRDEYYHPDSTDVGIAEVIIAKNRMGESATVKLAFAGKRSTFLNLMKGTT